MFYKAFCIDRRGNLTSTHGLTDYSRAQLIDAMFEVKEISMYSAYGSPSNK